MWYDETIYFYGESGTKYSFFVCSKNDEFESGAAVYIFLKKTGDEYIPLYIGQSENIGDRFEAHEKKKCAERHGWTHTAFHPEFKRLNRLQIETDLRHKHQTPCNRQ